jgi:hypothetical protein
MTPREWLNLIHNWNDFQQFLITHPELEQRTIAMLLRDILIKLMAQR